ncbi:MAG: hypothetical protein M1819_005573 [Sarea resinae]|nr:MAG: hypothetical protein M1819_005573 [Sarea resinae]
MWEKLEKRYTHVSLAVRGDLIREFIHLHYRDCVDAADFCHKFSSLVFRLKRTGWKEDHCNVCLLFLAKLFSSFEAWQIVKRHTESFETLNLNRLMRELEDEARYIESTRPVTFSGEARTKKAAKKNSPARRSRYQVKKTCSHCRKNGHVEANRWMKHPQKRPA